MKPLTSGNAQLIKMNGRVAMRVLHGWYRLRFIQLTSVLTA